MGLKLRCNSFFSIHKMNADAMIRKTLKIGNHPANSVVLVLPRINSLMKSAVVLLPLSAIMMYILKKPVKKHMQQDVSTGPGTVNVPWGCSDSVTVQWCS